MFFEKIYIKYKFQGWSSHLWKDKELCWIHYRSKLIAGTTPGLACTSNSQCALFSSCCGSPQGYCSGCCQDNDCPTTDICIIQVGLKQIKISLFLKLCMKQLNLYSYNTLFKGIRWPSITLVYTVTWLCHPLILVVYTFKVTSPFKWNAIFYVDTNFFVITSFNFYWVLPWSFVV